MVWEILFEVLDKHVFALFFLAIEIGENSYTLWKRLQGKCKQMF